MNECCAVAAAERALNEFCIVTVAELTIAVNEFCTVAVLQLCGCEQIFKFVGQSSIDLPSNLERALNICARAHQTK